MYVNTERFEIDTNYLGARVRWDVEQATTGAVQLDVIAGAIGLTVVTFYRSNDGLRWYEFSPSVTLGAEGFSAALDCAACRFIEGRVTTAAGASNIVALAGCFKADPDA